MTVDELYKKLSDPGFQDTENGDLFYNFYVFQYEPEKEYEIQRQIQDLKNSLERPNNFIDLLALDIYEEFIAFLKEQEIWGTTFLDEVLNTDKVDPDGATKMLTEQANSEDFLKRLHEKILTHKKIDDDKQRPFIIFYGMGKMYPYLRTSTMLAKYEQYNLSSEYKIIVFYPGQKDGNSYRLFNRLYDQNTYRATLLLNDKNE
jgi:Domain of unknown function (DUF1788).